MKKILLWTLLGSFMVFSCQNPITKAARKVEYSAYELIGIQKRDLLKNRVRDAREEQKKAGENFSDALEQLNKVYGLKGGNLEKKYKDLKSRYDKAADQAESVHQSVRKVESVAGDLFKEWDKEIDQMETASLKEKSRARLKETQARYDELHAHLKTSESKMDPVLKKLNDNVLYLKHNLNAKAIGSLKGEVGRIQTEIETLLRDMNKAIQTAEKFIHEMQ